MKIGILTWLHNNNYGTVLQAYALQRFLRDAGYNVTNIDYAPGTIQKTINLVKNGNSPKLFLEKYQAFQAKKSCDAAKLSSKNKKFDEFQRSNFVLSDRYTKPDEISECGDRFDVFISGSDQIWSPELLNPVYYLDFVQTGRKISYAASFGVAKICSERKKRKIKRLLSSYSKISVREDTGKSILSDLEYNDVEVVIDPTLLLDRHSWEALASDAGFTEPYLFCYLLTDNKKHFDNIRKVAKENGLKIITVSVGVESYHFGDIQIADAGPEEWLALLRNAVLVCTDSFHGLVFSTIFNKECRVYKRFLDENSASQNSRIRSLCKIMKIEEKKLPEEGDCIVEIKEDQYSSISSNLSVFVQNSKNWLMRAIEMR